MFRYQWYLCMLVILVPEKTLCAKAYGPEVTRLLCWQIKPDNLVAGKHEPHEFDWFDCQRSSHLHAVARSMLMLACLQLHTMLMLNEVHVYPLPV